MQDFISWWMIDDKTINNCWFDSLFYLIEMLLFNLMEMILFTLKASLNLRNKAGPSRYAQDNYKLIWTDLSFKYSVLP